MSTYTIIKLNTGQDIICSLDKADVSDYSLEHEQRILGQKDLQQSLRQLRIENPMLIHHSVSADGTTITLLKRYNPLALSTKMVIDRSHVIATYAPQKQFANYYCAILAFHEKVLDQIALNDIDIATSFIDAAIMNEKFEESFKNIKEKKNAPTTKKIDKKLH